MRVSEIKLMLRKAGCRILREGANHEIWYSQITGKRFTVPRHDSKEIPKGTEKSIREAAGV